MEIPTKYEPHTVEEKWYKYWMDKGMFKSKPDQREPYCIVIPPPNVTGVLHMGHMLNNTIQDVLVRRARMEGKNALWVPGTDHASIATEAKVVAKLKAQGIDKHNLTRDEFLKHAWEWTELHGGIILEQLKKLGASCDWDRTAFTMDEIRYESVIDVFIDLYNKGYIYRGCRMVNWDPQAKTAVSDEEVIYQEVQSKLYYVRYKIHNEDSWITIATTRPETILGDTAICVHPDDARYTHLRGKHVEVPLLKRIIPIIFDEYVDKEFGTGALKVTPAHDINDYNLGQKYDLEVIDIFNPDGTLSPAAQLFVGEERFAARDLIAKKLQEEEHIVKIENYNNKVGISERTHSVIEPRLSLQWFLKMKELSKPALDNVMNDTVQLLPAKFKNTYKHWMENVRDWCISRQLWWGHRIPAYFIGKKDEVIIAKNIDEALEKARKLPGHENATKEDLRPDEDVLDTWFSSWLWPISVFDGIRKPNNEEINYYYPTSTLVTAPDILFFWVARMIIAGYEYRGNYPFKNVYLTGLVRDETGRKMSKQFGNSPDPLDLIEKYSADGVRVAMLLCSSAGNDLLFDISLPEQGRNFGNKIWNAFRLVSGWNVDNSIQQPEAAKEGISWFTEKLNESSNTVKNLFEEFRISEALMTIYRLFWDEFSGWYLEIVKPGYQQPIDAITYNKTISFFEQLLQLLHPFTPFITEEIWHFLKQRSPEESIMQSQLLPNENFDIKKLDSFNLSKELITFVRNVRKEKNILNKEALTIKAKDDTICTNYYAIIKKLANISEIETIQEKVDNAASVLIRSAEFYIPIGDKLNKEEELKKLNEDLKYAQKFLESVEKKLSNERFIQNAAANIVELERKKKSDAESKIKALEIQIAALT